MRNIVNLLFLTFAATAQGSSIVLTSTTNGVYNYALHLEPGEFNQFAANSTALTLTGMSGVFAESVNDALDFCLHGVPIAPTAASLVANSPGGCGINNPLVTSVDDGSWFVQSTSNVTGLVNYSITTNLQTFTGQVLGPVAAAGAPEPSTLGLAALGLMLAITHTRRFV